MRRHPFIFTLIATAVSVHSLDPVVPPPLRGEWRLAEPKEWCSDVCDRMGSRWNCNADVMKEVTTANYMLNVVTELKIPCNSILARSIEHDFGPCIESHNVDGITELGDCFYIDAASIFPQTPTGNVTCMQMAEEESMLCYCEETPGELDPLKAEEEAALMIILIAIFVPFSCIFCGLVLIAIAIVCYLRKRQARHRKKKKGDEEQKMSRIELARRGFAKLGGAESLASTDSLPLRTVGVVDEDAQEEADYLSAQDAIHQWVASEASELENRGVLWKLFQIADEDCSGSISLSELRTVLPKSFTNVELAQVMDILDDDNNNEIDFVEFQNIKSAVLTVRGKAKLDLHKITTEKAASVEQEKDEQTQSMYDLRSFIESLADEGPSPLPEGWEEMQDDDGKTYFHSETLGTTQWERPSTPGASFMLPDEGGGGGDASQFKTMRDV